MVVLVMGGRSRSFFLIASVVVDVWVLRAARVQL